MPYYANQNPSHCLSCSTHGRTYEMFIHHLFCSSSSPFLHSLSSFFCLFFFPPSFLLLLSIITQNVYTIQILLCIT